MTLPLMQRCLKYASDWLMREHEPHGMPLCDFERIRYELRPCDVILVEGRARVSEVIKVISQSPWSHAALYIGRIHDIENPVLRERVREYYDGPPDTQLLIESQLGMGTVVTPLERYRRDHIRICRPRGLARQDAQKVIGYAIGKLGWGYNIRHVLDLARFAFPWGILPRRWRSSLFSTHPGHSTRVICSSMLAEAFMCVQFPILPLIQESKKHGLELIRRNPKLYTPSDFDYSPYFEIIKYPFIEAEHGMYRHLPWSKEDLMHHDKGMVSSTNLDDIRHIDEHTAASEKAEAEKASDPDSDERDRGR